MPDEVTFQVKPEALATVQTLSIIANFEECKVALESMIAPYKTMAVTENGIAEAKSDRARIRKVATTIDETRKTVKKAYSAPLADFEAKCKELVAICDEGSSNLDKQIKAFEEAEADAKIASIRALYEEGDDEVREFCAWETVYNDKWRNKSFSFDDAKNEILEAFRCTRDDISTIRTMDPQDVPALLTEYKRTHNIGATIRLSNTLKQQRDAERQRKAEKEAEADSLIAHRKIVESKSVLEEKEAEIIPTDFRVWANQRQLMSLKGFLRANGIRYGRVE